MIDPMSRVNGVFEILGDLMALPLVGCYQIYPLTFLVLVHVAHPLLSPGGPYSVLVFGGQVSVSLVIDCKETWHPPTRDYL